MLLLLTLFVLQLLLLLLLLLFAAAAAFGDFDKISFVETAPRGVAIAEIIVVVTAVVIVAVFWYAGRSGLHHRSHFDASSSTTLVR